MVLLLVTGGGLFCGGGEGLFGFSEGKECCSLGVWCSLRTAENLRKGD